MVFCYVLFFISHRFPISVKKQEGASLRPPGSPGSIY